MIYFFLIPVYNESKNIEHLAENLCSLQLKDKYFVFVDDCSHDDTVTKINTLWEGQCYHIIRKEKNIGPGDSFNRGFEWILQHTLSDSDIIITLEGDNTSDLTILSKMITISGLEYDLVLASVYAQGGGFVKTSLLRKLLSYFANMLFRTIFNVKILTLSSFYRVYHITLVKSIKSKYQVIIDEKGFISMLEILLKAISLKAKIIEVPTVLNTDKRTGRSKMKRLKTALSYLIFLFRNKNKFK